MPDSRCPLCDSKDIKLYCHSEDYFFTREPFDMLLCDTCGLIFTAGAPAPSECGKYYKSDEYYSHPDKKKGIISSVYDTLRNIMLGKKRRMVASATGGRTGRILEVGSGSGYFLKTMAKNGWTAKGYEQDRDAVTHACDRLGLDVCPGDGFFAETESFDVITLWHVLEHLYNPDDYMAKFAELLPPAGTLILALPNPTSYDARRYGKYWAGYDLPRHLWHFTPEVIKNYAAKFGFTLVRTRPLFFDSYYCALLSEGYRGKKCRIARALWVGTISNLNYIFKGNDRCSSVVYIFKKE